MSSKKSLRETYKKIRKEISEERRAIAEEIGKKELLILLDSYENVLSYASFNDEFSTCQINEGLLSQKKLLLPKISKESLHCYKVNNLEALKINKYGIAEPEEIASNKISFDKIEVCLIPGISFDSNRHRIGYGKGFYDRFLKALPVSCLTIGIGFQEQFYRGFFTSEAHDIKLSKIMLF